LGKSKRPWQSARGQGVPSKALRYDHSIFEGCVDIAGDSPRRGYHDVRVAGF